MVKVSKKPTAEWFIRPLDQFTNQSLAEALARTMDVEEGSVDDKFFYNAPSYDFIQRFVDSSRTQEYRFEIWRRRIIGGKLEKWPFGKKKKIRRTRKYKKAKMDLARLSS